MKCIYNTWLDDFVSESRREARSSAYKKDEGEGMTMDTDEYSITMDVLESLEAKVYSIAKQCESIDHNLKNLKKLIESFWRNEE